MFYFWLIIELIAVGVFDQLPITKTSNINKINDLRVSILIGPVNLNSFDSVIQF